MAFGTVTNIGLPHVRRIGYQNDLVLSKKQISIIPPFMKSIHIILPRPTQQNMAHIYIHQITSDLITVILSDKKWDPTHF